MMTKSESGLIVNFKESNVCAVEAMIKNSGFYGYEIGDMVYLFPSEESDYDMLEKTLEHEFLKYHINSFSFEGIFGIEE